VLQVVVQGVSLVSPGSTVCVLLVLQCVLHSVLRVCVAGCVATWCCVLQIRCCSVCCRVCRIGRFLRH